MLDFVSFLFKVARTYNTNTPVRARTSKSKQSGPSVVLKITKNRLPFPKFDHRKNETCSQRSVRRYNTGQSIYSRKECPARRGTHDQTHKEERNIDTEERKRKREYHYKYIDMRSRALWLPRFRHVHVGNMDCFTGRVIAAVCARVCSS